MKINKVSPKQKVKKQHYVPQKSLSRFASRPGKIFVFDKLLGKTYENDIAKTACEQYFYDLKTIDHDPNDLEKFQIGERAMCEVEALAQPILDRLIEQANLFLNRKVKSKPFSDKKLLYKNEKEELAFFIAVQYFRTPNRRAIMTDFARMAEKIEINIMLEQDGISLEKDQDFDVQLSRESQVANHLLFSLTTAMQAVVPLSNYFWLVSLFDENKLVTSDAPVIPYLPTQTRLLAQNCLLGKEGEIAFNLCPNMTLVLCDRSLAKGIEKFDGRCQLISSEAIFTMNALHLQRSYRYIYSHTNDFEWAKKLLEKNPEWKHPVKFQLSCSGPFTSGVNELLDETKEFSHVLFRGRKEHFCELE